MPGISFSSSSSRLSSSSSSSSTEMENVCDRKSKKDHVEKKVVNENDEWLGVTSRPTRRIPNTPYFVSRMDKAVEPEQHPVRLNYHGYDRDDPKDAIKKFEKLHPESDARKAWNAFTDVMMNFFTLFVPGTLSLSAGSEKQRIDQKVVLRVVRESVDKFPELKIRMSKEAFDLMDPVDQCRWHKKMTIIRAAQHDYITNELAKAYPNHIDQNAPTILYSGGRATGLLRVLYCSMDEYIALYWSDWGLLSTDSGAYEKAHVYDYITEGHNINWNARFLEYNPKDFEVTTPGEYTFLGRGDRKIWSFEGPCGMVDHGIGNIPSMAKFAIANNAFVTLNSRAVGSLISNQAKAVAHEYAQRMKEAFGCTEVSVHPVTRVDEKDLAKAQTYFAPIVARAEKMEG